MFVCKWDGKRYGLKNRKSSCLLPTHPLIIRDVWSHHYDTVNIKNRISAAANCYISYILYNTQTDK